MIERRPHRSGRFRPGLVGLAGLALTGCASDPSPIAPGGGMAGTMGGAVPSIYLPLSGRNASLDTGAARDMISAYRRARGGTPLTVDPELQRLAETEAAAMAVADKPSQSRTVRNAIGRLGYESADANLSAGYRTLAEAFSGWRDSPEHNAVMLAPGATRIGIATAYAPGSKYKVYWALLVAK